MNEGRSMRKPARAELVVGVVLLPVALLQILNPLLMQYLLIPLLMNLLQPPKRIRSQELRLYMK